jgi:hypothetical protein
VSCCSDGEWQVRRPDDAAAGERPSRRYLRWFRWAVIPTDAGLAKRLLGSLSRCLVSVAVNVAGRGRRAHRGAKADTRGTVVTSKMERLVGPGFLVAHTQCYWGGSTGCVNDGFRSRRWCFCYDRAGVVVQLALDWLVVELLVLEPRHWDGVDFRVWK